MDSRPELPPPQFYLSRAEQGGRMRYFFFTDVRFFQMDYAASPNEQPLPGRYAPYISEGSGNGFRFPLSANLTPMHEFSSNDFPQGSGRRGSFDDLSRLVYEDLNRMEDIIREYGPTPLFMLHRPLREPTTVALYEFGGTSKLSESVQTDAYTDYPATIPITMTLVERLNYYVKVTR